jgi:hypothetical protein
MECAIVAHSGSGAFNGCMVKAEHSLDTGDHHWRWSLFYSKRITGLPLILLASVEAPAHLRLQNPLPGAAIYVSTCRLFMDGPNDLERFCQDGNWELTYGNSREL